MNTSYQHLRDSSEGFVDMGMGDGLIKVESIILGIVAFIFMIMNSMGIVPALVVGVLCAVVFPIIAIHIKALGWVVAVVFSAAWAVVGYFIGGAILDVGIGIVIAIVVFIICFFVHKVSLGLGYSSVEKIHLDSAVTTANSTSQTAQDVQQFVSQPQNTGTRFCSACGAKVNAGTAFCPHCGNQL